MWLWSVLALMTLPVTREADLSAFREVRVEASLEAADVAVLPVKGTLLRVEADYPEGELKELVFDLREKGDRAVLKIETDLVEWWGEGKRKGGEVWIELPDGVTLDLEVRLAAADADFDLSGLALTEVRLKGAASELDLRFDRPNPKGGRRFRIEVAAAAIRIENLGNAGFREVELRSAVSDLTLDLGGRWKGEAEVEISATLANVGITAPAGLPLRVKASGFLTEKTVEGLIRTDDAWETPNFWERSPRVTLRFRGVLSAFDLEFE